MSVSVIAIDGPAASGKSTVARRVAAALGRVYVDSGALYRGVTWKALRLGIDTRNAGRLVAMMRDGEFRFTVVDGAVRFTVDGDDPGMEIRGQDVTDHVSRVAAHPEVREQVVAWLRDMTRFGGLVMEGRDIGTAVFPDTPWKFYLDADAEERARRRHAEMAQSSGAISQHAIDESLRRRDAIDSGRKKDPLRVAEGARVIDSTRMRIDDVVAEILARVS